jgi:hypothetical protein
MKKSLLERYERARRGWAEKGGLVRFTVLRYWEWRYYRATIGRLEREARI